MSNLLNIFARTQHLNALACPKRGRKFLSLILFSCLASVLVGLETPKPGYLYWSNGPPNLDPDSGSGGDFVTEDTDQRYLAVSTDYYFLEFDVREGRISKFNSSKTIPSGESGFGQLTWSTENRTMSVSGNQAQKYSPDFFPVRIVESGPWFQHFTIHDIVLRGENTRAPKGQFWMEIMAWPDRVLVALRTQDKRFAKNVMAFTPDGPQFAGILNFHKGEAGSVQVLNDEKVITFALLEWKAGTSCQNTASIESKDPKIDIRICELEGIPKLQLAKLDHEKGKRTALGTPEHFGIGEEYEMTFSNKSDQPSRLDFMVELPDNRSLTGHSLMLIDSNGNQTGIPIQISKNWHIKKLDKFLPYMGTWSHGRISLILPPKFKEEMTLQLIQSDFGPYNAASIAQLSLVGWGGNGFWIQAALGSWGETVCLQPGRVLRRTYLTDWRPFNSQAIGGGTYDWSANAGGADIFVYFDKAGNYVPFIDNKHLIASNGPCLAQMNFHETSKDGKVEVRGTWSLPMSNDVARVYLKVRCDFLEETEFSRFSILQVGADRYNPESSPRAAFGNSEGVLVEQAFEPGLSPKAYLSEPVVLAGDLPWLSMFGEALDLDARIGQAQRIVVVREWKAVLGGEPAGSPSAAFYNSRLHDNDSFHAELVPGKDLTRFEAGDSIEMTLEFVLMPLSLDAYAGKNPSVLDLLKTVANQPQMAQSVAIGNHPELVVGEQELLAGAFPAIPFSHTDNSLTLSGTSALVPLTITGIPSPGRFFLSGKAMDTFEPAQEWRKDPETGWNCVLMLDTVCLSHPFQIDFKPPLE
ncbi:hypothetical protein G0Q06_06395 [Puniceicoccales bacterium CK1056]|uniref:Uncharacterized protein n=1 Tax=Oceanipulchritudo coccoides TaxID=2706888 RepID=A0A6B2M2Z2_9BACT|nr:hypothetical protein [Oceanipulchritudo coccoides]NDV62070.1 hypothetical protein [Oceanipulchritudo coccoides]